MDDKEWVEFQAEFDEVRKEEFRAAARLGYAYIEALDSAFGSPGTSLEFQAALHALREARSRTGGYQAAADFEMNQVTTSPEGEGHRIMSAQTTVLTIKQLAAAHLLARAHGHLWATVLEAADLPATAEGIRAAVYAAHGNDIGIFYPSVELVDNGEGGQDAYITHETASKRTLWHVDRNGDVIAVVSRGGDYDGSGLFSFHVPFGITYVTEVVTGSAAEEGGIGQRHVDAAAKTICALTGRTKEQALSSLRAEGIEPCGPAYMAERVAAACWELAHHYVQPAEFEHYFTWHSNAAELAAIVSLTVARNHVKTDPTRPWVRAAEVKASMSEYWEALEEDMQASK